MVGALTMLLVAGSAVAPPGAAAGPAPAPGRWVSGEFTNEAGTRRWSLYVPASLDPKGKPMLVVLLHGCTQDAADIARGTRIAEQAEKNGFLALLPEQPESANMKKCWNWYDSAHQGRDAGEPSIIAGLTAKIVKDYHADADRVHLAGISAGAAMASLVAVAYPEMYASVAFHSGLPWRAATNVAAALGVMAKGTEETLNLGLDAVKAMGPRKRPIPALIIQGGSDKVVNPANADGLARQWLVMNTEAIDARTGGMAGDEVSGETNGYHWKRVVFGDGPLTVDQLVVEELGHAWSGGSKAGTFTDERGPDAMAEMVTFFRAHPRGR
ncbi:MAG TPA: PHB depolymerase family esterase [Gemmatimonadaceae bacterium]|nr:PHB depolymerase family esterase [Gemmatimonadaceae bacterium]